MEPKAFVLDAAERAGKTFAQALLAFFTAGVTVATVDWRQALVVAGTAAVISILSSVASLPVGDGTASLIKLREVASVERGAHEQ